MKTKYGEKILDLNAPPATATGLIIRNTVEPVMVKGWGDKTRDFSCAPTSCDSWDDKARDYNDNGWDDKTRASSGEGWADKTRAFSCDR